MFAMATMFSRSFFHGTKADLQPGSLIEVGPISNFTDAAPLSWVYCSATLDATIWGAELADGSGPGRIYVVKATRSPSHPSNSLSTYSSGVQTRMRCPSGSRATKVRPKTAMLGTWSIGTPAACQVS